VTQYKVWIKICTRKNPLNTTTAYGKKECTMTEWVSDKDPTTMAAAKESLNQGSHNQTLIQDGTNLCVCVSGQMLPDVFVVVCWWSSVLWTLMLMAARSNPNWSRLQHLWHWEWDGFTSFPGSENRTYGLLAGIINIGFSRRTKIISEIFFFGN
jgi:hypothetical protein